MECIDYKATSLPVVYMTQLGEREGEYEQASI